MTSTSPKRLRTTAWMNKKHYKTDKISHQNTAVFYMAVFLCYTKIKKEYSKKCAWNGGIDRIIMVQCNERNKDLSQNCPLHIPISLFACSHLHMCACAGFHPSHSYMRVRDAYNLICGMFRGQFCGSPERRGNRVTMSRERAQEEDGEGFYAE